MELSLPHLILRELESPLGPKIGATGRAKQLETDLAFLNLESSTGQRPARFSIRRAQDTILVFGCDHSQWTGYSFSDREHTDPYYGHTKENHKGQNCRHGEEEGEGDDANDTDDEDDEEEMPDEDLFASGESDHLLDANHTLWNPRTYFLCTAAIRVRIVYDEYNYLIQTLDAGTTNWVRTANTIFSRPC